MLPAAATTMFAWHVHLRVVAGDRVARDRRDHLGGADHRPPERMVAEHGLGDQVVHELLRRVVVHRDLLEHDLALGVQLGERGREHHLAHHVHRRLEVVIGDARVDERVLARCRGVQLAAQPVEDLGDLQRAVPLGSLEQQVLDEVRHPRFVRLLVARAGGDPVADRGRAHMLEPLGDHAFAGVELGQPPVLHGGSVVRDALPLPDDLAARCRDRPRVGRDLRRRSLAGVVARRRARRGDRRRPGARPGRAFCPTASPSTSRSSSANRHTC